MKKLRILALAIAPALAAVFTAHAAQAQERIQCEPAEALFTKLREKHGEFPTGAILTDDTTWEKVELYADPQDGSWSAVGKPREHMRADFNIPAGVDSRCVLMGGDAGYATLRQHPAFVFAFGPLPALGTGPR